ncbi:histidine phosphatase family protein [Streptomyces sp. V2I9]|uniref:histidine phosphatase family protein n=1 Tax=Streptomyces sp. V2I9 TaxID=3042304 RepID=UPI00277E0B4D|nr:histidine phosphatase family protein [Streptomyces sp. V2I9]MDQ0988689.1 broad specificity phosphatase PhoE [Streptomyces sp. V2I9]
MTSRLLLVRHGETAWHAENRYAGVTDVALTPRGLAQGAALGTWAVRHRVDAVTSSPLTRARLTAAPAAAALDLTVEVQEGLREVDFGWGEGRTVQEMAEEDPEAVRRFREDADAGAFPGSEPVADAAARATTTLRDLAHRHRGGTVLVVAHNTLLRIALCDLLGLPLGRYRHTFPRLDNGAVTEIEIHGTRTALRSLNVPTTLPPPAPAPGPTPAGD